ncbi:MAG TPA: SDR family oxidoreductase [Candidatus Krumholzibacteria bacterium]|nr:SDR family oxidoreductase [Candidatus Krumholzibacteria bacterium]
MDLGVKGRMAVIAASSKGLGFACALEFAREGAAVAICSHNQSNIRDAEKQLLAAVPGARVHAMTVDLSSDDECRRFVDESASVLGRLDILVTNCGGPPPGSFDQVSMETLRANIDATMMAPIAMMKAAVPHMRRNAWGRIVNLLSLTVKQPRSSLVISNTLRLGVVGYARTLANDLAREGITVNNIATGYARTERLDELAEHTATTQSREMDDVFADWERVIPAQRLGRPEELAAVVAFLGSERASYVTGVTMRVDGGWNQSLY